MYLLKTYLDRGKRSLLCGVIIRPLASCCLEEQENRHSDLLVDLENDHVKKGSNCPASFVDTFVLLLNHKHKSDHAKNRSPFGVTLHVAQSRRQHVPVSGVDGKTCSDTQGRKFKKWETI